MLDLRGLKSTIFGRVLKSIPGPLSSAELGPERAGPCRRAARWQDGLLPKHPETETGPDFG
jgi:hypothetical protein